MSMSWSVGNHRPGGCVRGGVSRMSERTRKKHPMRSSRSARAGGAARGGPLTSGCAGFDNPGARRKTSGCGCRTAESSVTQHRLSAGGKVLRLQTATRRHADHPRRRGQADRQHGATIAYDATRSQGQRRAAADVRVQNGGPGSSSLWLHMGVLGPKRVVGVRSGSNAGGPRIVRWTTNSGARQERPGDDRSGRDRREPRGLRSTPER